MDEFSRRGDGQQSVRDNERARVHIGTLKVFCDMGVQAEGEDSRK